MITAKYSLVRPRTLEREFVDLSLTDGIVVRPSHLSICKADLRYFLGQRDQKILNKRLPLVLIHEAVGTVVCDPSGKLERGTRVVMLPNIPGSDPAYAENYRLDSRFRSSRTDGFLQEMIVLRENEVLPIRAVPNEVASFTELISVGVHAVASFLKRNPQQLNAIGVWGDGAVGYIICCLLKKYLPDTRLTIIGGAPTRLAMFSMADEKLTVDEVPDEIRFDHAFECVGGAASGAAVNQMIDCIRPEGMITLMGVSEEPVPINTRMVLEKGLTLIGRSRSAREDFAEAISLLESDPVLVRRLSLLISETRSVSSIGDIEKAFELARTVDFKVIMEWKI